MAELFGFLKLLPSLIALCIEAQKFIKSQFGDNPEKAIADLADTFKRLREAKTTEDRVDAAKKISDLIGSL